MNRKKETNQPLENDIPLTSKMNSEEKPAGGDAVPADGGSQ